MGKQYRPQIVDKCYNSKDGVNPTDDQAINIYTYVQKQITMIKLVITLGQSAITDT